MLQYSQENTCVRVSFCTFRSAILLKRDTNTYVSCECCETFKNTHFEEQFWTAVSYFMKKVDTAEG